MRDIDHTETMDLSFSADTAREALDQTPWLRQVPAATLDRLAEQAVLHRVPKGSTLFEQSETPAFAQFLVDGRVDLIAVRGSNEAIVEVVRPVDLLLPAAVLNRQPYLARARALEDVQTRVDPCAGISRHRRDRSRVLSGRPCLPGGAVPPPGEARTEPEAAFGRGAGGVLPGEPCGGRRFGGGCPVAVGETAYSRSATRHDAGDPLPDSGGA